MLPVAPKASINSLGLSAAWCNAQAKVSQVAHTSDVGFLSVSDLATSPGSTLTKMHHCPWQDPSLLETGGPPLKTLKRCQNSAGLHKNAILKPALAGNQARAPACPPVARLVVAPLSCCSEDSLPWHRPIHRAGRCQCTNSISPRTGLDFALNTALATLGDARHLSLVHMLPSFVTCTGYTCCRHGVTGKRDHIGQCAFRTKLCLGMQWASGHF